MTFSDVDPNLLNEKMDDEEESSTYITKSATTLTRTYSCA
jgi:hypothetical protein